MRYTVYFALAAATALGGCATHNETARRFASLDAKLDNLAKQHGQDVAALTARLDGHSADLKSMAKQQTEDVAALTARLDGHDTKLAEHGAKLEEHEAKLEEHQAKLEEHETRLSEHADKLAEHDTKLEEHETKLAEHEAKLEANEAEDVRLSQNLMDAIARANAAHRLAEGKFSYGYVMNGEAITFGSGKAELSEAAKQTLRDLAKQLTLDNKNRYLEIQGHADSVGRGPANAALGLRRAEAVRAFLNLQGVALNRMSVISYGDVAPVDRNKSAAGSAANRRVEIVVVE